MIAIINRGRTPWATGPSEAFCLVTKVPPAESCIGCDLQSYDKRSGLFLQLPLCFAKMINLELWASLHVEMHVSTRAAISLERECWTVFEVLGWFLSGAVGKKQHSLRIGHGQVEFAKFIFKKSESQIGWVQCRTAEEFSFSASFWQWNNKGIEGSFRNQFGFTE